ncbi:MAG: hypothetical protein IPP77_10660 [Bacteroidetes bacterium]|nr:hypothetical protein [Bacteroidota bacterium]
MKWLPVFFLLFVIYSLSAQVVEISNPYRLPAKASRFRVIGKNNDGVVVRLYGTEDIMDVFDDKLKLISGKTIDFRNQSGLLQHIMLNRSGAVIFYLLQEKKYSVLMAQPVSASYAEIGKPLVIDTIVDRKDLVASNLRFRASPDQSNLLIYYPYFNGNKVESIQFLCLDQSLKPLYHRTVPINRDEQELEDSKSLVDNDGNALYMLRPPDQEGHSNYDAYRLSNQGDLTTYRLVIERTVFGESSFELDSKNGNLVVCGFFGEITPSGESAATGIFYSSFDPANGIPLASQYISFPNDFMVKLTGRQPGDISRLYTFNIRKALLRNDGGAMVLAESFIKDTREIPVSSGFQPGFNSYRTSESFQFNDVIAFSIAPDGTMEWNSVMRKTQKSEDDNGAYSSFLIMNEKDKLRLIYVDDLMGGGTLTQYILNSDGTSEKKTLLSQNDNDVLLLPKLGKQITPNQVVIPSYKSNSLRLLKIAF